MAVGEDGPPDECAARTYVYTTGFSVYGLADAIGPIRHTHRIAWLPSSLIRSTLRRPGARAAPAAARPPPPRFFPFIRVL